MASYADGNVISTHYHHRSDRHPTKSTDTDKIAGPEATILVADSGNNCGFSTVAETVRMPFRCHHYRSTAAE
ncbi:hypothetical protein GWI33_006892 [Rhynchophorus ferrugineus]|uniref:Uncharacterized protein n=1 Tax=Rhynchophorus ferrugineus TaxID=354439 RepID=A0A834IGM0_RHYFE|nr:hypothetical protein GWI33_006892 [Rhynchophorus ferrugineus]